MIQLLINIICHPYLLYFHLFPPTEPYPSLWLPLTFTVIVYILEIFIVASLGDYLDRHKTTFSQITKPAFTICVGLALILVFTTLIHISNALFLPKESQPIYQLNATFSTKLGTEKTIYKHNLNPDIQFFKTKDWPLTSEKKKEQSYQTSATEKLSQTQLDLIKNADIIRLQKDKAEAQQDVTIKIKYNKKPNKNLNANQITYHLDKITIRDQITTRTWYKSTDRKTTKLITIYVSDMTDLKDVQTQNQLKELLE